LVLLVPCGLPRQGAGHRGVPCAGGLVGRPLDPSGAV